MAKTMVASVALIRSHLVPMKGIVRGMTKRSAKPRNSMAAPVLLL
jgi:hypothetical protein